MKALLTFLSALFTASVNAQFLSGPIINPENGHTYLLLMEDTWQNSEAKAVGLGGHLVTINDAAEQSWVYSTFGTFSEVSRSLWIGLSDQASEGDFVWSSGEPVDYTHWISGQPDNALGNEDFVHMVGAGNEFGHAGGLSNDLASPNTHFPTFDPISGVVEVVPEPSTYALLICGVAVHFIVRRFTTRMAAQSGCAGSCGRVKEQTRASSLRGRQSSAEITR